MFNITRLIPDICEEVDGKLDEPEPMAIKDSVEPYLDAVKAPGNEDFQSSIEYWTVLTVKSMRKQGPMQYIGRVTRIGDWYYSYMFDGFIGRYREVVSAINAVGIAWYG